MVPTIFSQEIALTGRDKGESYAVAFSNFCGVFLFDSVNSDDGRCIQPVICHHAVEEHRKDFTAARTSYHGVSLPTLSMSRSKALDYIKNMRDGRRA